MLAVRADTSVMKARGLAMRTRMPSARESALRGLVDIAAGAFDRLSPRDTNRYVRGWLEAVGQAGSSPRMMPALKAGRNSTYLRKRIIGQWVQQHRQVLRTEKWLNTWYPPGKKRGAFARRQFALLEKMKKREERLKQEIETLNASQTDAIILIGGRGKKGFATVRTNVYGGVGFIDVLAGVLYLRNREPHAFIVEAKMRVKQKVGRYVNMLGGRTVGGKYATTLIGKSRALGLGRS